MTAELWNRFQTEFGCLSRVKVAGCQDVVGAGWKSRVQILISSVRFSLFEDNSTFQLAVKYLHQAKFIIKSTGRDRKIWS